MKKLLTIVISILLVLFLGGCDLLVAPPKTLEEEVSLVFWHSYTGEEAKMLAENTQTFNEEYGQQQKVSVVLQYYPREEIAQKLANGETPDLFLSTDNLAFEFADTLAYYPIEDVFAKTRIKDIFASILEDGNFYGDEKHYLYPLTCNTTMFYIDIMAWNAFKEGILGGGYSSVMFDELQDWKAIAKASSVYNNWTDRATPDVREDGGAFFAIEDVSTFMYLDAVQRGYNLITFDDAGVPRVNFPASSAKLVWDYIYGNTLAGRFLLTEGAPFAAVESGQAMAYVDAARNLNNFGAHDRLNVYYSPFHIDTSGIVLADAASVAIVDKGENRAVGASIYLNWLCAEERIVPFAALSYSVPVYKNIIKSNTLKDFINTKANSDDETDWQISETLGVQKHHLEYCYCYSLPKIKNAPAFLQLLGRDLKQIAMQDRAECTQRLAQGELMRNITPTLDTQQKFNDWYTTLKQEMEAFLAQNQ